MLGLIRTLFGFVNAAGHFMVLVIFLFRRLRKRTTLLKAFETVTYGDTL